MKNARPIRYLAAGAVNTVFGYFFTVGLFELLSPHLWTIAIAALANVVNITFSFTLYKRFVFRSRGNWLTEYLRSYAIYGTAALASIALLWLLVDIVRLDIWLAQAGAMLVVVIFSYVGHSRFTFAGPGRGGLENGVPR